MSVRPVFLRFSLPFFAIFVSCVSLLFHLFSLVLFTQSIQLDDPTNNPKRNTQLSIKTCVKRGANASAGDNVILNIADEQRQPRWKYEVLSGGSRDCRSAYYEQLYRATLAATAPTAEKKSRARFKNVNVLINFFRYLPIVVCSLFCYVVGHDHRQYKSKHNSYLHTIAYSTYLYIVHLNRVNTK